MCDRCTELEAELIAVRQDRDDARLDLCDEIQAHCQLAYEELGTSFRTDGVPSAFEIAVERWGADEARRLFEG